MSGLLKLIFVFYNLKIILFSLFLRINTTKKTLGADPFGFPTLNRPWDDQSNSIENAQRRMRVAFDFMSKLGVKVVSFFTYSYWIFFFNYLLLN